MFQLPLCIAHDFFFFVFMSYMLLQQTISERAEVCQAIWAIHKAKPKESHLSNDLTAKFVFILKLKACNECSVCFEGR